MSLVITPGMTAGLVGMALRSGVDVRALLDSAGIAVPEDPTAVPTLSDAQVRALARAAWLLTDDDLLGFGSHPVPRGTMKMLCFAMASVSDLGAAIGRFAEFSRTVAGLPPVELRVSGEVAEVRVDTSSLRDPDHVRVIATAVATHRLISWVIGDRVPVRWIELPFPAPADTQELDLLLGERLRFDGDAVAFVLDRAVLGTAVLRDEAALLQLLRDAPTVLFSRPPGREPLTRLVRHAIEKRLRDHEVPTADELARQLSMSVPTLRRRLRAEGTSLRSVRDALLCRMAVESIERGGEPLSALSERLGFSEPSAFTRAFRRWTGSAPSEVRPSSERG